MESVTCFFRGRCPHPLLIAIEMGDFCNFQTERERKEEKNRETKTGTDRRTFFRERVETGNIPVLAFLFS